MDIFQGTSTQPTKSVNLHHFYSWRQILYQVGRIEHEVTEKSTHIGLNNKEREQDPTAMNCIILLLLCSAIHGVVVMHAKLLQSRPTLCNPTDCSPPGSSIHGILQARILEWLTGPFSRGSSRFFSVSYIASGFFITEELGKPCRHSPKSSYLSCHGITANGTHPQLLRGARARLSMTLKIKEVSFPEPSPVRSLDPIDPKETQMGQICASVTHTDKGLTCYKLFRLVMRQNGNVGPSACRLGKFKPQTPCY